MKMSFGRAIVAVLMTSLFFSGGLVAEEFPTRRAGLWVVKTTIPGMSMNTVMKQCADSRTDKEMMEISESMAKNMPADCKTSKLVKSGSSYSMSTTCSMRGMTMKARVTMSGDFETSYKVESTTTFEPPMVGMQEQKTTMTATWEGPCEPGQKPGDIIMGDNLFNGLGAQ